MRANVHFSQGDVLFRAGEPANTFYVIRHGRVALDVHDPRRGTLVIDTLDDGEVVGWSWLVPPYAWMFDARAGRRPARWPSTAPACAASATQDPALGYALMQRVSQVMYERLQAARVRLLDLYGSPS